MVHLTCYSMQRVSQTQSTFSRTMRNGAFVTSQRDYYKEKTWLRSRSVGKTKIKVSVLNQLIMYIPNKNVSVAGWDDTRTESYMRLFKIKLRAKIVVLQHGNITRAILLFRIIVPSVKWVNIGGKLPLIFTTMFYLIWSSMIAYLVIQTLLLMVVSRLDL